MYVVCINKSFISFLLQNIVYLFNFIYIYIYTIFITYKYTNHVALLLCHFQTLQILTTLVTIYRC
jgi:hypothetical protein